MKKLISLLLALALLFSGVVAATLLHASAALNDGKKLTVVIKLEVGRYSGGNFVPLKNGETVEKDEVLTVRIRPQSDFLCGVTRYIVMFSKEHYQIVGSGKSAFTPNFQNAFYAAVAPDWTGTSTIPEFGWPESMRNAEFNTYSAVAVNNQANSNSANGGYPDIMPGDWLFRFDLKVLKKLTASSPGRIYIDNRWLRTPSNTTGAMYFTKVESADQLAATGSSTIYNFIVDLKAADVTVPLSAEIPTLPSTTAAPTTTRPPVTTTLPGQTTVPGTTGGPTSPNTSAPSTVRPGDTTSAAPTTGIPVTDSQGETVPVTDAEGKPVPVTDAQGEPVTDEQGSTVYQIETRPVETTTGVPVTDAEGKPVPVTDEQGEPVTDEDGNTVFETEPYTGEDGSKGTIGRTGRAAIIAAAVLLAGGGGYGGYMVIKKKRG